MKKSRKNHNGFISNPSLKSSSVHSVSSEKLSWIDENILKLECSAFLPKSNGYCGCGRSAEKHTNKNDFRNELKMKKINWNISRHTTPFPTDAYGTLEFQGGPHPTKARYVRMHYQTTPTDVLHLLLREWNLRVPNLVISIIGGLANFELQPKLKKVFTDGLVKAAKTTGTWVVTTGLDTGVTKHVGEALKNEIHVKGNNIVALGISPWGIVQHRKHLLGKEKICPYYSIANKNQKQAVLNQHHNYFLLADNGTVDKFGAEIVLRRSLERYLATQSIRMKNHGRLGKSRVPVVAVLVEGGMQAFRLVFELVTDEYPVPVVVCEGSGRAADLLAFMHRYSDEEGDLSKDVREQVLKTVQVTFSLVRREAELLYEEMKLCLKRRELITVYRMEDNCPDIDVAILTALLQESLPKLTKADQLTLTMAWNRPDIARSQIFGVQTEWHSQVLDASMVDALINDRLEFVKLLLENGVNMHRFLKVSRLEYFYNVRCLKGDFTFYAMLSKVCNLKKRQPVLLRHVGLLIEILMGGGYQHQYCHRRWMERSLLPTVDVCDTLSSVDNLKNILTNSVNESDGNHDCMQHFRYPYTELFQWTILTRRYDMAMYMVMSGEESIAKSLMAVKLLKGVKKFLNVDNESEYLEELKNWENKFEDLAVKLQNHCYIHDPEETKRLLCYELQQFSGHTGISLAYLCQSKPFLGHVCTQNILNDLWYGGLREGKWVGLKVLIVLLSMLAIIPAIPIILITLKSNRIIEFKTKQELALQPQTLEEYLNYSSSDSSSDSSSSDDETTDDVDINSKPKSEENNFVALNNFPIVITEDKGCKRVHRASSLQKESMYTDFYNKCSDIAKSDPTLNQNKNSDDHIVINMGDEFENNNEHIEFSNRSKIDSLINPGRYLQEEISSKNPCHFENSHLSKERIHRKKRTIPSKDDFEIGTNMILSSRDHIHVSPTRSSFTFLQAINGGQQGIADISHRPSVTFNNPSFTKYIPDTLFEYGQDNPQISPGTQLSCRKKIYEFFYAPITKFYLNVISHFILILLLIRLAFIQWSMNSIDYLELYVYIAIATNFLDHFRKFSNTAGINIAQKMKVHFESLWNFFDFGWGFYCLIAFSVRYIAAYHYQLTKGTFSNSTLPPSEDRTYVFLWSRNLIILGSSYWILKSLELMQNWRLFGAYIEMIRCMIKQIAPPVVILSIIMTAFGVVRQGIMYHGVSDLSIGNILKNVYLKPYFMLYGEVYAPEIDPLDFPSETRFSPLAWTVPIAMVLFMLCAVVVILSLIIAGITDIYGKMKESSVKVYMYLRYPIIIDYESRPFAPPPFIILVWLYLLIRKIYFSFKICLCLMTRKYARNTQANVNEQKTDQRDHSAGLKLFLSIDDIEKLHDFEEECVEDYWRQARTHGDYEPSNVIKRTLQCMDHTQFQIGELHSRFNIMRINLQCTNNNLNDLNMNYNCQRSTLLEKINHLENKLNLCMTESGTFQYRRTLSNNKKSLNLVNENTIHHKNSGTSHDITEAETDLVDSIDNFHNDTHIFKRVKSDIRLSSFKQKSYIESAQAACPIVDKYSIPLRRDYTTICDDIIISDWLSCKETPPASPTTSLMDLSQPGKSKKSNKLMKSKAKRNKLLSNKEKVMGDKEEELRQAEKIERDEMASVIVQRLRQLSHKQSYSSKTEIDDNHLTNGQEIGTSKSGESASTNNFMKSSKISSSLISFSDSKQIIRQHSTPIAINNDLVIFKLASDLD